MKNRDRRRFSAAAFMMALLAACASAGPPAPVAVAVWDLEDLRTADRGELGLGPLLSGQVMAHLDASGRCQVVEREKLARVLEELQLGSSDLADAQNRLKLGRVLGARQMIFGAFQSLGPTPRVDLRLVDVASGKIIKTADGTATAADLNGWLQAADQAAAQLLE